MSELNDNTAARSGVESSSVVSIHSSALGDEDEDVHRCGRCGEEFSALDTFIQHKLSRSCKRSRQNKQENGETEKDTAGQLSADGEQSNDAESSRTGVRSSASSNRSPSTQEHCESDEGETHSSEPTKLVLKLSAEGRFICHICEKTFKTTNILRTHLFTHTDRKDFKCELCETAFRTKGSLIRHKRRHTDERPYRCSQCGLAFRESGALTRHLKSLTPCTEKIRYSQCKEILISKDGLHTELQQASALSQKEQSLPVVSVVETAQNGIHIQVVENVEQVHQMVSAPQADALVEEESLICQAIINSGIALEAVATETAEEQVETQPVKEELQGNGDEATEEVLEEEYVVMKEETEVNSDKGREAFCPKLHKCPHCTRTFRTSSHLRIHIKGHVGYKAFKCVVCQKEFLTGYMLKKHMVVHVNERRYKCGECGKLFKAIGHVREHMRAHSNERPHCCSLCCKTYKTKNALQVHQRTHNEEKPYVCPHCSRGFREKGALVRHIRHHTGEKPFKCSKCGRGFAEHGTLNRHLRSKGGCYAVLQKELEQVLSCEEQQECAESVATAIMSDDPHAVLVEFSSVVADTQEYIIRTSSEEATPVEEVSIIQGSPNQMDSHIMKVVQQIVSQSRAGHQIIVRNAAPDDIPGDAIAIATPESLTQQVAMTLASAVGDAGILTAETVATETPHHTVTVLATEEVELIEQHEHQQQEEMEEEQQQYVITTPDEMEIQTVVVV